MLSSMQLDGCLWVLSYLFPSVSNYVMLSILQGWWGSTCPHRETKNQRHNTKSKNEELLAGNAFVQKFHAHQLGFLALERISPLFHGFHGSIYSLKIRPSSRPRNKQYVGDSLVIPFWENGEPLNHMHIFKLWLACPRTVKTRIDHFD